jgi:hypothetical protein
VLGNGFGYAHVAAADVEALCAAARHERLDVHREALGEHVGSMPGRQRLMQTEQRLLRWRLVFEGDRGAHAGFS